MRSNCFVYIAYYLPTSVGFHRSICLLHIRLWKLHTFKRLPSTIVLISWLLSQSRAKLKIALKEIGSPVLTSWRHKKAQKRSKHTDPQEHTTLSKYGSLSSWEKTTKSPARCLTCSLDGQSRLVHHQNVPKIIRTRQLQWPRCSQTRSLPPLKLTSRNSRNWRRCPILNLWWRSIQTTNWLSEKRFLISLESTALTDGQKLSEWATQMMITMDFHNLTWILTIAQLIHAGEFLINVVV